MAIARALVNDPVRAHRRRADRQPRRPRHARHLPVAARDQRVRHRRDHGDARPRARAVAASTAAIELNHGDDRVRLGRDAEASSWKSNDDVIQDGVHRIPPRAAAQRAEHHDDRVFALRVRTVRARGAEHPRRAPADRGARGDPRVHRRRHVRQGDRRRRRPDREVPRSAQGRRRHAERGARARAEGARRVQGRVRGRRPARLARRQAQAGLPRPRITFGASPTTFTKSISSTTFASAKSGSLSSTSCGTSPAWPASRSVSRSPRSP